MRTLLISALFLPVSLLAQGSIIIPRPCLPCPTDAVCTQPPPCRPQDGGVVKQSSNVRAVLVDRVLRYEVTETFVNHGSRIGEADYIFPLPKGAAFQDLQLSINGEMVSGETMSESCLRRAMAAALSPVAGT